MSRMYGELIAAAAESVGSDPATTNVGRLTYRTDTKVFRGYADAAWRTIATLDQVQAFSNKSFSDAPTFSTMTIGSILFAGTAGVLTQDNTNLTWTAASKTLTIGGGTSEFFGADAAESFIRISGYNTSASNIVGLYLRAYRGTRASPTVLVNADAAAAVRFQGQSTSTVVESALIAFVVDAAPGAGTVPTAIIFTTGTGAANAEAMRITSGGVVGIGGSTVPGNYAGKLTIYGAGLTYGNVKVMVNVASTDATAYMVISASGSDKGAAIGVNANNLLFAVDTGASDFEEKMRLTSAGNLSVGVSNNILGSDGTANATAGNIGEVIEADSAGIATGSLAASGVAFNVVSISLTAGDWDVSGQFFFSSGATSVITASYASIGTTSATTATDMASALVMAFPQDVNQSQLCGPTRMRVSGTTTVYLVARLTYSVNGGTAVSSLSKIRARRMR